MPSATPSFRTMNELSSEPTGALIFDLCAKFGLLERSEDGGWIEAAGADEKIALFFGM